MTEHKTNGCTPSHLSVIAGVKSLYSIVLKETNASFDDYDFFNNLEAKNVNIIIDSTPSASIFETIITKSEVRILNEAIRLNQGFNIGVYGYERNYWAGQLFKHVVD